MEEALELRTERNLKERPIGAQEDALWVVNLAISLIKIIFSKNTAGTTIQGRMDFNLSELALINFS